MLADQSGLGASAIERQHFLVQTQMIVADDATLLGETFALHLNLPYVFCKCKNKHTIVINITNLLVYFSRDLMTIHFFACLLWSALETISHRNYRHENQVDKKRTKTNSIYTDYSNIVWFACFYIGYLIKDEAISSKMWALLLLYIINNKHTICLYVCFW